MECSAQHPSGTGKRDSHKLHVSLGHTWLELSAEMISGKASGRQPGSRHAFLCQLNVRDDSHLKLFSKFNILPKTPGLSSSRHLAPPHELVRSPRGAGFRPEIPLAAPSRLFEALTHFPLPSGGVASGKTDMEQMPFAPSCTVSRCSVPQARWPLLSVFAVRLELSPADRHGRHTELCNPPAAEPLHLCEARSSWPQELSLTPHLPFLLSPGRPTTLMSRLSLLQCS